MTFVKICGITNLDDARAAIAAGADAIGLVFVEATPRYVSVDQAARISRSVEGQVRRVGVFCDAAPAEVQRVAAAVGLDLVQLHGDETPETSRAVGLPVLKAVRPRGRDDLRGLAEYRVEAILLDTYVSGRRGGTGETFDWGLALEATRLVPKIILSGGLGPHNVAEALEKVRPYGVDVSSGVEGSPGKKDHRKIAAFVAAVREFDGR